MQRPRIGKAMVKNKIKVGGPKLPDFKTLTSESTVIKTVGY